MNKPFCLGQSILDTCKIAIHEFRYDYVKLKYKEKTNLVYVDEDSFIIQKMLKQDLIMKDWINKIWIRWKKWTTLLQWDQKHGYLTDDSNENKEAKVTKKCAIKEEI